MLFGSNLIYRVSAIINHHCWMNCCHRWSCSGLTKKLPQIHRAGIRELSDVSKPSFSGEVARPGSSTGTESGLPHLLLERPGDVPELQQLLPDVRSTFQQRATRPQIISAA